MNAYEFIIKMKDHATSGLRNIAQSAGVADDRVERLNREAKRSESAFSGLKRTLATVFTVAAIVGFTTKVIDARQEYEKFNAVLTNTFQSADVGKGALNMLTDFAAKTPFQLNELTGSFIKLVNRGFLPAQTELRKMGDLASSQGKSFDQLTEAVLDAQTGEFERLKEFGIKASKAGNSVSLSFKGVTQTVNNNADAIQNAILAYGQMDGVAGSMDAISKTLGGRISNLKDQWWGFLVAFGGESGGVLNGFIDAVSAAITFLSDHLAEISLWFKQLFSYIAPVITSIWNFVKAALGIKEASSALTAFGSTMNFVLLIVDFVTAGLGFLIDMLTPIAPYLLAIAAAWTVWNYALGVWNALMLVSPTTWIIIGIVALIAVIGMVVKYTHGWGEAWQHTVNGAKALWESFANSAKSVWLQLTNNFMIGINSILKSWYMFKNAVGMGDSSENDAILRKIQEDNDRRKQEIIAAKKQALGSWEEMKNEFGQVSITVDKDGIKKDWQGLKDKFAGAGLLDNSGSSAYDDFLAGKNGEDGKSKEGKKAGDTIVSGGTKHTNINITIQKLQDDTKIYVSSKEEGLSQLGDKVQEMLLRAVNSVNQMQTS